MKFDPMKVKYLNSKEKIKLSGNYLEIAAVTNTKKRDNENSKSEK